MKNFSVSIAPCLGLYLLPTSKACPAAGTCRKICLNTAGNPAYFGIADQSGGLFGSGPARFALIQDDSNLRVFVIG